MSPPPLLSPALFCAKRRDPLSVQPGIRHPTNRRAGPPATPVTDTENARAVRVFESRSRRSFPSNEQPLDRRCTAVPATDAVPHGFAARATNSGRPRVSRWTRRFALRPGRCPRHRRKSLLPACDSEDEKGHSCCDFISLDVTVRGARSKFEAPRRQEEACETATQFDVRRAAQRVRMAGRDVRQVLLAPPGGTMFVRTRPGAEERPGHHRCAARESVDARDRAAR